MPSIALALMSALVTMVSACTRQAAPRPDAGRPSPGERAPVRTDAGAEGRAGGVDAAERGEDLRRLERGPLSDPAFKLACSVTGRVAMDADSAALNFTAAFLKVGILPIRLSLPSTLGVMAGPVEVTTPVPSRISARATTEWRGDGTAYQVQVSVAPPVQGWTAGDSVVAHRHGGALCGRVAGLAFP